MCHSPHTSLHAPTTPLHAMYRTTLAVASPLYTLLAAESARRHAMIKASDQAGRSMPARKLTTRDAHNSDSKQQLCSACSTLRSTKTFAYHLQSHLRPQDRRRICDGRWQRLASVRYRCALTDRGTHVSSVRPLLQALCKRVH